MNKLFLLMSFLFLMGCDTVLSPHFVPSGYAHHSGEYNTEPGHDPQVIDGASTETMMNDKDGDVLVDSPQGLLQKSGVQHQCTVCSQ